MYPSATESRMPQTVFLVSTLMPLPECPTMYLHLEAYQGLWSKQKQQEAQLPSQLPFATRMEELALFQGSASSNKLEANWFQWFAKLREGLIFTC